MAVDLIKKWMDVTRSTRGANSQIVKEKDLIVPDGKLDVQKILLLDGKIRIDHIDIQTNRISYKGQIDVTILYVPEGGDTSIVKMSGNIPLEDFMIVENLEPSDRVDFNFDIESMHYQLLNERKINVKAIIALDAVITTTKEISILEDIRTQNDNVEKKTEEIDIITMLPFKEDKKILKEELTIPQNKPAIGEILKQTMQLKDEQIKRTDDELIYSATVEIDTMYQSIEDENVLDVVTHKVVINGNIPLFRDDNEQYVFCELDVMPTYDPQISPDYDGEDRIIETEYIITAKYTTYGNEKAEIINDIYCPGKKVDISGENQTYQNLIFKDTTIAPKKVNVNAQGLSPENNNIFNAQMKAKVDDYMLDGEMLNVEGFAEIIITYITMNGEEKVGRLEDAVPFEIAIPITLGQGQERGGSYDINVNVKATNVNVVNYGKDNITLDYILEFEVEIHETRNIKIIDDISFEDMSKDDLAEYPSIIVYTIKPGENMWEIAKRFNTTVEDIAEINEFEKDTKLKGGEKVIIVKKNKF